MADLEAYQQALKDFLVELPARPGQINSGTPVIPRVSWDYM